MTNVKMAAGLIALSALGVSGQAARAQAGRDQAAQALPAPIVIDGDRIFPESLDAGSDGTLYIGSIGKGAIFKAPPGSKKATLWITKAAGKLSAVDGVVADEAHNRLWVCSSDMNHLGEPVSLKAFDIKTGAPLGDYPFLQNKGLCNDIAIGKDGTAYATDTPNARIFRLTPGASKLEIWITDPRFVGIDGVMFGLDGQLYVNNVRTSLLYRIAMKSDGSAGAITPLQTPRPLDAPDGMRPTKDGRFAIAENRGGRISVGSLSGDMMQIESLRGGFDVAPGVAVDGSTLWAIEMKSKYRNDPAFKNKDPGPFVVTPIALPPKT